MGLNLGDLIKGESTLDLKGILPKRFLAKALKKELILASCCGWCCCKSAIFRRDYGWPRIFPVVRERF